MATVRIGSYVLEGLSDGMVDTIRKEVEVHLRGGPGYLYLDPSKGAGGHQVLWVTSSTPVWFTYDNAPSFLRNDSNPW